MGKYKVLTGEFADLMLGYYGYCIGPRDPEVVRKAEKYAKKPVIKDRPADFLKPEWDHLREAALALPGSDGTDEDVLTYAMFPQVAPKFFQSRAEGPKNLGKDPAAAAAPAPATANGPKADSGTGPVMATITYDVKLNRKVALA